MKTIFPPYLKKGDTIGITLPAGYMASEKAQTCINTLQDWGYDVMVGKTLGSNSENYFSGTDEERLDELQAMLDDKNIKAVLFGRGGYGTNRIIDQLDFKKFRKNPKWLIGFSDITIIHCHLLANYNISAVHAPMAAAFNEDGFKNEYVQSLKKVLAGEKMRYTTAPFSYNKKGKAEGILTGGNLALFVNMIGTKSEPDTKGKILFLEDVGEYLYNIDRMMRQLKRSGKLKNLAGLVLGGFSDVKDTERPFGKNIDDVLREIVDEYDYPIAYHFPVSHDTENYALKVGGYYKLNVNNRAVSLREL